MTWDSKRLTPSRRLRVLDTSVVLNLLACGSAVRVLECLGARFIIPHPVVSEVVKEPPGGGTALPELLERGLLSQHPLEGAVLDAYIDLVGAPTPDGLDDGEAAAIALAESMSCEVVIDERKARRIAAARRPGLDVLSTVDLFHELTELKGLDTNEVAECVYSALKNARMRVLPDRADWVLGLVGTERAADCPSMRGILRGLSG